jgi:hypothetical protein
MDFVMLIINACIDRRRSRESWLVLGQRVLILLSLRFTEVDFVLRKSSHAAVGT